jgi:hypothetical protein
MAVLTHTYTKTYALMDPWAETIPWECLVRETNCCAGPEHDHSPMVDDPCAVEDCREPLRLGETCYAVGENKLTPPAGNPNGRLR